MPQIKKDSFLNLKNSNRQEQRTKMEQIIKDGVCPFCQKYLKKYHDKPIIKIGKYWSLTENDYPYIGTDKHYLFIYNKHVTHIDKITKGAFEELSTMIKYLSKKHQIKGGAITMRFGDSDFTHATVEHLHGHLIVGGKYKKGKEIMVPVGYQKN